MNSKAKPARVKIKRHTAYCSNSSTTFNIILSGDIHVNPGPSLNAPTWSACEKTVKCNQKRFICDKCFDVTHGECSNSQTFVLNSGVPCNKWTCNKCLHTVLPFFKSSSFENYICNLDTSTELENTANSDISNQLVTINHDITGLNEHGNHTSIAHLNAQCLSTSTDEFNVKLNTYGFDIISISETWLKGNKDLIDYVQIPGYEFIYNNREHSRGGSVACYIKEHLEFKERKYIYNLDKTIEHQWIEVKGKNKNKSFLVGCLYQPRSIESEEQSWCEKFDNLPSQIYIKWDGVITITRYFNIDLKEPNKPSVKKYNNILETFHLKQHMVKPTRMRKTLIDHIITNIPKKIGDHDLPYVILNIRKQKFDKCYQYIRDEKRFDFSKYQKDFSQIPMSVVDIFDDPNDQLYMLNEFSLSCINQHAPLRRVKLTRPPALWMADLNIQALQH